MPTGYTSKLYEGQKQSFNEFAMSCARNFGALVMMRDEPMDAVIPEQFTPSTYHSKALLKAQAYLEDASHWTEDMWKAEFQKHLAKETQYKAEQRENRKAIRHRYEAMLSKVRDWEPPSPDHQGLKDFMISQLTESIDFDTREYKYEEQESMTWEDYKKTIIEGFQHDVKYHREEQHKENERTAKRNKWLFDLRMSLPYEE